MNFPFITLALCLWFSVLAEGKLLSVAVIFRHGDRNPAVLYPSYEDSSLKVHWNKSQLGQLTEKGILRARTLGQVVRDLYKQNGPVGGSKRMNLTSAPVKRCEESLKYFLEGFVTPDESVPPVHVHSGYSLEASCPRRQKMLLNQPFEEEQRGKHRALFKYIDHNIKLKLNSTLIRAFLTLDTYRIMKEQGLTPPSWITNGVFNTILKFNLNYLEEASRDTNLLKMSVGTTFNDLNLLFNGSLDSKFYIQSTHDVNLILMLNSFGIYQKYLPGYSSALIFELHSNSKDQKFFKLFMLDDPLEPKLKNLRPQFCTEINHCPIDSYYKATEKFNFKGNWTEECQLEGIADGKSLLQISD